MSKRIKLMELGYSTDFRNLVMEPAFDGGGADGDSA